MGREERGGEEGRRRGREKGMRKELFLMQEAEQLGNKDRLRLLTSRKLALIVDLDQTLVHTSMDPNIEPGLPVRTAVRPMPKHSQVVKICAAIIL